MQLVNNQNLIAGHFRLIRRLLIGAYRTASCFVCTDHGLRLKVVQSSFIMQLHTYMCLLKINLS